MSAAALVASPSSDLSRSTEADGIVVEEGFCQTDSPYARIYKGNGEKSAESMRDSEQGQPSSKPDVANLRIVDSCPSVGVGDCLPPSSPFGEPLLQNSREMDEDARKYETEKELQGMDLPERLLSGLSSLSHNDFALYMQLTEELAKELDHSEEDSLSEKPSGQQADSRAQHDEKQLQQAVKRLESMLPKSAISQLQSHASYGLLDLIHARPGKQANS